MSQDAKDMPEDVRAEIENRNRAYAIAVAQIQERISEIEQEVDAVRRNYETVSKVDAAKKRLQALVERNPVGWEGRVEAIRIVLDELDTRDEEAEAFRALKDILEGRYRRVHLEKEIEFEGYWAWTDDEYKELADTLPKAIFALEGELNR